MAKTVEVPVDALRSYMEDYHNPRPGGYCKADGEDWPCPTVTVLRQAIASVDHG